VSDTAAERGACPVGTDRRQGGSINRHQMSVAVTVSGRAGKRGKVFSLGAGRQALHGAQPESGLSASVAARSTVPRQPSWLPLAVPLPLGMREF
jgi:hypothetical protein